MADPRGLSPSSIDASQLERIARIARSLPGRLVSVKQRVPWRRPSGTKVPPGQMGASSSGPAAAPPPRLRIDGVDATEIVARYEHVALA